MGTGETLLIYSQLILGALAVFLNIMIWSKTRDIAWLFFLFFVFVSYIEIIYSILKMMQIIAGDLTELLLPSLKTAFLTIAFLVIIIRQYNNKSLEGK